MPVSHVTGICDTHVQMGNILALQSTKDEATANALAAFRSWTLAQVDAAVDVFKKDINVEFYMSLEALKLVVKDDDLADQVFSAYNPTESSYGILDEEEQLASCVLGTYINGMHVLTTLVLVADTEVMEKAAALFTLFDFNDYDTISYDDLVMMFIQISNALKTATGFGEEPSVEKIKEVCDLAFTAGSFVKRDEYLQFVRRKILYIENEDGDATGVQPYVTDFFKTFGVDGIPYPPGVTAMTIVRNDRQDSSVPTSTTDDGDEAIQRVDNAS